jgi:hypothetical protein
MKFKFETLPLPVESLDQNIGQVSGVPGNPRTIDRSRLERLRDSLSGSKEMLDLRPVIVYLHKGRNVVIAGNMRAAAAKMAGLEEIPCHRITSVDSVKSLREIAIKDNLSSGKDDFESLIAEWDSKELDEWGLEIPSAESPGDDANDSSDKPETVEIVVSVPVESADDTVAFLASNGYECKVKPVKKKKK